MTHFFKKKRKEKRQATAPLLQPALGAKYKLDGTTPGSLSSLAGKIIHNFDLVLDHSSPKLSEMFNQSSPKLFAMCKVVNILD